MARTIRPDLTGIVIARDAGWATHTLAAGDRVPDGVDVGEHLLSTTTEPAPATPEAPAPADGEPRQPKGNGTREEWAAYADALGIQYPDDAKRDDIKAAIAAHVEAIEG